MEKIFIIVANVNSSGTVLDHTVAGDSPTRDETTIKNISGEAEIEKRELNERLSLPINLFYELEKQINI